MIDEPGKEFCKQKKTRENREHSFPYVGDRDGRNRHDPDLVDLQVQSDDQRGAVSVAAHFFAAQLAVLQL